MSLDGDDHDFFNCCILSTIKKSPGVLSAEGSPRECLVSVIFKMFSYFLTKFVKM